MEKSKKDTKTNNEPTKKVKKTTEQKKWFLVNAKGKIIGRLATRIAKVLLGKGKVSYLPYKDSGDYVVVVNAAKVEATGRKEENKKYYRYSGYPGGLKERNLKTLRSEKPEEVIRHAVSGMLPKTRLGKQIIKKLYIYPSEKHPHEAQKVESLEF
jgi:large subunit ribosomal protein L13